MGKDYGVPDMIARKCAVCGAEIFPTSEWIYKRVYRSRVEYFCSYGHKRLDEKRRAEAKVLRKRGLNEDLIVSKILAGEPIAQIAREMGCTPQNINYYREKLENTKI